MNIEIVETAQIAEGEIVILPVVPRRVGETVETWLARCVRASVVLTNIDVGPPPVHVAFLED